MAKRRFVVDRRVNVARPLFVLMETELIATKGTNDTVGILKYRNRPAVMQVESHKSFLCRMCFFVAI
jgi:hypothetical protein